MSFDFRKSTNVVPFIKFFYVTDINFTSIECVLAARSAFEHRIALSFPLRCRSPLKSSYTSPSAMWLPEDLTGMKYLECVIKETMRLFPIMPAILRAVMEDFQIGAHTYPRGSTIVLGTIHVQRSPTYWPDPLKFDPDRFSPEETAKRHSFAYLPFSGGMRNCVGSKYAMMSMKAFLAIILRRYILKKDNIVPVKDIRLAMAMLLRPINPIQIRIERRRRQNSN